MGLMDDRAMSACGDQSSGPGLPLPDLCASIALALILDGLHLGPSKIGGQRALGPRRWDFWEQCLGPFVDHLPSRDVEDLNVHFFYYTDDIVPGNVVRHHYLNRFCISSRQELYLD